MAGNRRPTWQKFPAQTLRRLFDAVNTDDIVDASVALSDPDAPVTLPDPIVLACPEETLRRCFALCLQFWEDGAARPDLLRLVDKLLRDEGLSADERLEYKNIRARYKHLRFAQRLYGKRHQSDYLFDKTTIALGHLQDAFRSGRRSAIVRYGLKLRLMLSMPVWWIVKRAVEHTRMDSEAGVFAYQQAEMRQLKETLAGTTFAGHEFHRVRKIISMHVSFYDTLRSLEPSDHAYRMSRFLAAINGLMGAKHDEMVAEALAGRRDYQTPVPLARETRTRLEMLIARYPL